MIVVTHVGRAEGAKAAATALACTGDELDRASLLIELGNGRPPRPTLVASAPARRLEERLTAHLPEARVASRGRLCHLALPADETGVEAIAGAAAVGREGLCVLHLPPGLLQNALDCPGLEVRGALLRADLSEDRALTALAARDLIGRGLRVAVLKRRLNWVVARQASLGVLSPGSSALPCRLVERLTGDDNAPSHPCYGREDAKGADTAGVAERERRDHASTGSR